MDDALLLQVYPEARQVPVPAGLGARRAFEVLLRPFGSEVGCDALLHHLQENQIVDVTRGTLSHPTDCVVSHVAHPLRGCVSACAFKVLFLDFGAEREPIAFALSPRIDRFIYPAHPHLIHRAFLPRDAPQDALCAYFPSDESLSGDEEAFIRFIDYVAIFLAKHVIWVQSRIWLGHVGLHDPRERLRELRSWDKCFCGSGGNYFKCHRDQDRLKSRELNRQEELIRSQQSRLAKQKLFRP
jgi:hypothetical protein